MNENTITGIQTDSLVSPGCWYCANMQVSGCECGRAYCQQHAYGPRCLLCALESGSFDHLEHEPVADLVKYSLSVAADDPYIVIPSRLHYTKPLAIGYVERLLGSLLKMLRSPSVDVRVRAVRVLASTVTSWQTMDPSQLARHNHGTSLIATSQVRRWLLHVLKESRVPSAEPVAFAILDNLIKADFRDLYPGIADNLTHLKYSSFGTRVTEVVQAIAEFYPTNRYSLNERCELAVYTYYTNRQHGVGDLLERLYGRKLIEAPVLSRALKRGVRHANLKLYHEWYPGEPEYDLYE